MTGLRLALSTLLLATALAACGDDADTAAEAETAAEGTSHAAHQAGGHHEGHVVSPGMDSGDGTRAEVAGYALTAVQAPQRPGAAGTLRFSIAGPAAEVQRNFLLYHERLMHVYVVRKDLTYFQHLHPQLNEQTGTWSTPIRFGAAGPYRLIAEFQALGVDGEPDTRVLGTDLTVRGTYRANSATTEDGVAKVEDFLLTLRGEPAVGGGPLTLQIQRAGAAENGLQAFLGSYAHVTGFSARSLGTAHLHPTQSPDPDSPRSTAGPSLTLHPTFSEPGPYRLFIQFQVDGKERLARMDVQVAAA